MRTCPADPSGYRKISLWVRLLPSTGQSPPPGFIPAIAHSPTFRIFSSLSWPDQERQAGPNTPAGRPTSGIFLPCDHLSVDRNVIYLTSSRSMQGRRGRLSVQFFGQDLALSNVVVNHPAFWRKIFRPAWDKAPLHKPLSRLGRKDEDPFQSR
jgi:hypothetical protein